MCDTFARSPGRVLCPKITPACGIRFAEDGSRPSLSVQRDLSAERNVTSQTAPCFIWHAVNDVGVPVENSLAFAVALRRVGVPFELHLYEKGGHGGKFF